MNKEKLKMSGKVTVGQQIAYGVGDFAGNLLSGATASYIALYYTDNVFMSAVFVGTMMMAARILDAVSDLVMGYIIDHTQTKIGKARPWFIISIIPLVLTFLLMFHVPAGLGIEGQKIYIAATYILNTVVCMTILNVSYSTLCTFMSDDIQTRVKLTGTRTFFATLAMMLANIFTVNILSKYGFSQQGYTVMVLLYGGVAVFCLALTALICKESTTIAEDTTAKKKATLKESFAVIFSNRYIPILAVAFALNWLLLGVNGASMVYYVRDVLGGMQYMGIVSAASFIPALLILAIGIVPRIAGKYGKRITLTVGGAIEALGLLIVSILPISLPVTVVGMILKAIGMAFVNALLFATVSDVAVYTDITQKGDYSGVTNSITSFGQKIGIGVGSAAVSWLLAWGQYDATLDLQTAQTQTAEHMGFSIIPCICAVVIIILISFINVDKKLMELRQQN